MLEPDGPVPPSPDPTPASGWRGLSATLGVALIAAMVGGAVATGGIVAYLRYTSHTLDVGSHVTVTEDSAASQVAAKAAPAVVSLLTQAPTDASVSGSGFLVDSSGYVVTNVGVVANSNSLVALLAGDAKPHDARLIDFDCQTQVAVVKIDGLRSLPTLPWADPAALQLGQTVVALAGPASVHSLVTRGIVSATHQEGSTSDPLHPEITRSLADTIQTDASSDSQSSGGPLLNVDGQVMGVTVNSPSTSSAFALSTAAVQPEVDQIIGTGSLSIATLGITSQDLGLGEAALHGEPVGGALVKSVDPGGPADRAGIKVGDVIRQLDDVTLDPAHPLSSVLRSRFTPSQKSTVTYQRDGSTNQVALTLSGGHPSC